MEGLDQFMQAIGTLESGNRYDAVGPHTGSTYGRARGRYQIMETIWPGWAREAGIPGADWSDPAAQDHVARHKMSQYFKRFGRWDLVAVAWFAGPGRAAEAKRKGIASVGGLRDVIGTSVTKYVQRIMDLMGDAPQAAPVQAEDSFTASARRRQRASAGVPELGSDEEFVEARDRQADTMASIMDFVSRASTKSLGGKVLDVEALFGDVFAKDDRTDDGEQEDDV